MDSDNKTNNDNNDNNENNEKNEKITYDEFINIFKKIKEEDTLKINELNQTKANILLKFSTFFDEFRNDNENYPSILADAYLCCGNTLSKKFREVFKTKSEKVLINFVAEIPKDILIGDIRYGATYLEPCIRIINTFNEFAYEQIIEFINNLYGLEYNDEK